MATVQKGEALRKKQEGWKYARARAEARERRKKGSGQRGSKGLQRSKGSWNRTLKPLLHDVPLSKNVKGYLATLKKCRGIYVAVLSCGSPYMWLPFWSMASALCAEGPREVVWGRAGSWLPFRRDANPSPPLSWERG